MSAMGRNPEASFHFSFFLSPVSATRGLTLRPKALRDYNIPPDFGTIKYGMRGVLRFSSRPIILLSIKIDIDILVSCVSPCKMFLSIEIDVWVIGRTYIPTYIPRYDL